MASSFSICNFLDLVPLTLKNLFLVPFKEFYLSFFSSSNHVVVSSSNNVFLLTTILVLVLKSCVLVVVLKNSRLLRTKTYVLSFKSNPRLINNHSEHFNGCAVENSFSTSRRQLFCFKLHPRLINTSQQLGDCGVEKLSFPSNHVDAFILFTVVQQLLCYKGSQILNRGIPRFTSSSPFPFLLGYELK